MDNTKQGSKSNDTKILESAIIYHELLSHGYTDVKYSYHEGEVCYTVMTEDDSILSIYTSEDDTDYNLFVTSRHGVTLLEKEFDNFPQLAVFLRFHLDPIVSFQSVDRPDTVIKPTPKTWDNGFFWGIMTSLITSLSWLILDLFWRVL